MQEELEICFKCLTQYLDKKRSVCPRFYFLTDPSLLALLSRPNELDSIRPHLRSVFSSISDIRIEKSSAWSDTVSSMKSTQNTPTPVPPDRKFILSDDPYQKSSSVRFRSGLKSTDSPHYSTSIADEVNDVYQATAVMATDKEYLILDEEVSLYEGVELWLQNLQDTVERTLHSYICKVVEDIDNNAPIEELAYRYPGQVTRLGLLHYWTKECENAIGELKWDRKSVQNTSKKFANVVSRLPAVLNRSTWKGIEEPVLPIHKLRLENMIMYCVYLRDCMDGMTARKIRETTDFEWKRSVRFYSSPSGGVPQHNLHILDASYKYGMEFLGVTSNFVMTPATEKAFVSMSIGLQEAKGSAIIGGTCTGKTETIQGLAALLGKYLCLIHCSESTEISSLARVLQGLATDGSWGCFDDVHLLSNNGLSVVLEFTAALCSSLKSKTEDQAFVTSLGDEGQMISVHRDLGLFLTFNETSLPKAKLSTAFRSFYRTTHLIKPDLSAILKAHCTALALRAPRLLADRLKTLLELAQQQLPPERHHLTNLPSVLIALNLAAQKRRSKEERNDSRTDQSRGADELKLSRSNSQTSVRQPLLQVSPSPTVARTTGADKLIKKTSSSPNTLTSQAKIDHGFVAQALLETISPGLVAPDSLVFNNIVRDVFSGIQFVRDVLTSMSGASPNGSSQLQSQAAKNHDMETAITQVAQERGLVAHGNWVSKVLQLHQMAQLRQGVVVAGPAGTGKSSLISVLVDALCLLPHNHGSGRASSPALSSHKLQRLNPMTVDDVSLMFGSVNHSNEWVDGILTHAWRKANRNQSTTWLCLDGPLVTCWADRLNSVLDGHKVLPLSNGERLLLTNNMRLVFETTELKSASPSLLSRTGLVYVDKHVLGWRPLAKAWLDTRTKDEVNVLQKSFNKTLDPVSAFVFQESRMKIPVTEVGLFSTCLTLLGEMLNEHQQHIGGDLHIERLFLFCLVWAYGGLLEGTAVKGFSDLLKTLSSALPDYDHEISVFDYYVDESGEWDGWAARVPEATYTGTTDILGEVFVDTVDTIRVRSLLEFTHTARKHTLIIGESGIGKTALINDFLDTQDKQSSILRRLVFSHSSTSSQLHSFIHHNIQHRQGFVYGAKDGKYLEAFIDDVNLPSHDPHGVQRCNELLRTLMDDHSICNLTKPFEWRTVEGLEVLATMSTVSAEFNLDSRLLRHFAVLRLRAPSSSDLRSVVYSVLEANLSDKPLNQELHEAIATASSKLIELVKDVLRPCPMPGRHHYAFSLRQLTKMCQCMRRLADDDRSNELRVVSLWSHEMERLIGDQLCRTADVTWFEENLKRITTDSFSKCFEPDKELMKYFVTFPVETKLHHRPIASSQRSIRIKLHSLNDPRDTLDCLKAHLAHYNEDQQQSHDALDNIIFSDDVLCHLIRMHRVLSYHHGGSMVIVGAVGSHLTQLTRLALHVADLRPSPIDSSRPTAFFDSLRTAVRVAGTDGHPVSVVLSARELQDPSFLDAINSLLVAGEYPHLFSNDELEGLLQVLAPTLRRHYPNMMSDPMKFFVSRVKCNLHIILILPPQHNLLKVALSSYPGIVSECQVIWIRDWPQEVLIQQAEYFINDHRVAHDTSLKAREALAMAIANMHNITLRDCKQTSWAGDTNPTVTVTGTSLQTKKDKESIKVEKMEMPNLPYSKSIILERIKLMNKDNTKRSSVEVFVGPYTYGKFMQCLHLLYQKHSKVLREETLKLKRALETLEETRGDAKMMKKAITVLRTQYNTAQMRVSELFKLLTTEATRLEKLKAHYGTGGGSLHAFLQLRKEEDSDYEEDILLRYEENDEYDIQFEQMREANLKSKRVQIEEEIEIAKKELEEARSSLVTAKNQVELWKSKVDRGCIERLKGFTNPPVLVAQVLEMVMVLVDAHPWLTGTRAEPQSQGRPETKTPRTAKRVLDHIEGSDKSSRVSSGSTLKTGPRKPAKPPRLNRQVTRTASSFGMTSGTQGDGSVDRNKWKSMQNFMNDTVRFVEMIHSVNWEYGLNETILQDVESYLVKGKDGQEGVTGEGSLLQEAQTVIHQRKATNTGITISAARYSSEDAAVLVEYVISIVEYTRLCGPLKHAIEHLQQLETEKDKIQQAEIEEQKPVVKVDESEGELSADDEEVGSTTSIEGLTKDDIQMLQGSVNAMQQRYDEAVVKKHRLKDELLTSQERLRSALNTLESLKPLEQSWSHELADTITSEELVTNCILAAAYLTYCGGMTSDARQRMTSFYTHVCEHYELPIPSRMLFRNYRLHEFLFTPIDVQQFVSKKLPVDIFTLDQACLLTAQHATWCLVCDPVAKIVNWLSDYVTNNLVIVQCNDLRAQFETCLSEGNTLLITYCDVIELSNDYRFREVLRHRREFHTSKAPFKIMVGDHEVECNPNFRLYLHTATLPQDVPPEIAAYTTLVYMQSTREGVQSELLDRFMRLEKPRLRDEWTNTQREKTRNMKILDDLEEQLKDILAGDFRLLNDLAITKKLAEIKKQYDEAIETQSRIDAAELGIERAKEGFREVALRGAVLFDVTRVMPVVNPLYHFSWQHFIRLYDKSIHQSERSALKVICSEMTFSIFFTLCQGLLERDRYLFALLMAIEIEDSLGNVNIGEREFLISPEYGHALMAALGRHVSESRAQAKKPFDWMSEDPFHNLQILATYFDWVHEIFDKMPKDGREMQWRLLCEGDSPESVTKCRLPDNADEHYTALQRLLVVRALRGERLIQASTEFIFRVLGKKYLRDDAPDLMAASKQAQSKTPIILFFSNENDQAVNLFTQFASKTESPYQVMYLNGCGDKETRRAEVILTQAMQNGSLLLLHNAHTNPPLIQSLYSKLNEACDVTSTFQLWISSEADAGKVPTTVLHASLKIVVDVPRVMKDNLLRFATSYVDSDVINSSSRPEWLPCLHNVCLLHGAIRLRGRLPSSVGWQQPEIFSELNCEQLKAAVAAVTREFVDIQSGSEGGGNIMLRNISWSSLRSQVSEFIYGCRITNPYDQQALNSLVDYWLAGSSVKKEFELPRVKYRLPSILFAPSVKQSAIVQSIDAIPQHSLEVAEACNLHPTSEAVIGEDQYIFTRLNTIYDFLPETSSLSHKLYPRPPTALDIPPQTAISNTSSHPWVISRGVFASHSHHLMKNKKEVELWEVCYNALPKLAKAWSREYVNERVRKLGGPTPFNLFLQKELAKLQKLLAEIKRALVAIKGAVESLDQFGDRLTPGDITIANELSRSRIPEQWMALAGETAPPSTTPLSQWLGDISTRVAHFERILAVGKDKMPAFWLGAFFKPRALIAVLKQEAIKAHIEKSGNVDNVVFHTEVTQRDKDHLRDPPAEGFFLHGVYMWGCAWDKTSGEMLDLPPKPGAVSPLPVIHVTFTTETAKYGTGNEMARPVDIYSCPVFVTRTSPKLPVFELDVNRDSIPSSRWSLRGLTATIRNY
uniref:Dynein heavy chain 8, axonemal-like n=1 Tax=Phallusia mammillata TaxID=59560 RepID=A0A6F9DAZ7_9ASCI|nr:dynein heavy chain 8, axonemal-like [Phallusia mammillata]